ncbi:MAG TPA: hypothetical protein DE060_12585 [Lentisphaeria bacterium]|nr:hypothetical protein [Lentisphaeria bacterium]HCG50026.1 hypothetical protein [Lentisphaeria bacterium]
MQAPFLSWNGACHESCGCNACPHETHSTEFLFLRSSHVNFCRTEFRCFQSDRFQRNAASKFPGFKSLNSMW